MYKYHILRHLPSWSPPHSRIGEHWWHSAISDSVRQRVALRAAAGSRPCSCQVKAASLATVSRSGSQHLATKAATSAVHACGQPAVLAQAYACCTAPAAGPKAMLAQEAKRYITVELSWRSSCTASATHAITNEATSQAACTQARLDRTGELPGGDLAAWLAPGLGPKERLDSASAKPTMSLAKGGEWLTVEMPAHRKSETFDTVEVPCKACYSPAGKSTNQYHESV